MNRIPPVRWSMKHGGGELSMVRVRYLAAVAMGAAAAALVTTAVPPADSAAAGAERLCGSKQAVVVARAGEARVFRRGSERELWVCRVGDRRAYEIGPVRPDGAPDNAFGIHGDWRLAAGTLTYRSAGDGCGRGYCVGAIGYVVDLRGARIRERPVKSAVALVPRADGAIVAITQVRPPAYDDTGARPGPGPFAVVRIDGGRWEVLGSGEGIDPRSLALRADSATWTQVGTVRSAPVPPNG